MVKYHIGKNGPAPCRANPDKPGGRACRYAGTMHGEKEEVERYYEAKMEAQGSGISLVSKKEKVTSNDTSTDSLKNSAHLTLGNKINYATDSNEYRDNAAKREEIISDQEIAMKLALQGMSPLSYLPVKRSDENFSSNGFNSTERLELEDGTVGYFKSFAKASRDNMAIGINKEYGETSISCAVNEVNAYRLSQEMGEGFDDLVPETVLREYGGEIGSFQKEFKGEPLEWGRTTDMFSKEDCHRAAVFDCVLGTKDRHSQNLLISDDEDPSLIDNSFSFPKGSGRYNQSVFADELGGSRLTKRDIEALKKAEDASYRWEKEGTIGSERAERMRNRIQDMISSGYTLDMFEYLSY